MSPAKKSRVLFSIDASGGIRLLYHDDVRGVLKCPGVKVTKLASVMYATERKRWEAAAPDGAVIAHGRTRAACVAGERREYEKRLTRGET